MEAVIVIHRNTQKCAEHVTTQLTKRKKPKHKLIITINTKI
jgi:hypothetical protein